MAVRQGFGDVENRRAAARTKPLVERDRIIEDRIEPGRREIAGRAVGACCFGNGKAWCREQRVEIAEPGIGGMEGIMGQPSVRFAMGLQ